MNKNDSLLKRKRKNGERKQCSSCNLLKPLKEFGVKSRNADNLDSMCLECHKQKRLLDKMKQKKQIHNLNKFEIKFKEPGKF
jgi:RNase P subunit RPR2